MAKARMKLVRDDSAHWYVIPADRLDDFEQWVAAIECYDNDLASRYDAGMISFEDIHSPIGGATNRPGCTDYGQI